MSRVAVVSGPTGGIGRWIARGLAQDGYHVVLIARSAERGIAARDWIAAEISGASTELLLADLSLLSETRRAGADIVSRYPQISLLINNAGVFLDRREATCEGHERVLAVNHLSPFVLTQSLEAALRAGAPSRLVTVGSSSSDGASIDPADLELTRGWNLVRAYRRSKLAQMMTTFQLAERWKGTGMTANVVHPGGVATGLVRAPGVVGLAWKVMAPFLLTEQQGADTPHYVATAPGLAGTTGEYFKFRKIVKPNRLARDPALIEAVWDATERLIENSAWPNKGPDA